MNASRKFYGKYVLARGDYSGLFAGTLVSHKKGLTELVNARRIWYWDGAASDCQIAKEGVKRPENCKFTVTVDSILLTDVIEIIPATKEAEDCIKKVAEWRA